MRQLKLLSAACLLFSASAMATDISGTIAVDTTLDLAGSPWNITSTLTVNSGITLDVDPGVEVIFNGNFDIVVYGSFNLNGTALLPVDVNGGGSTWRSIRYLTSSLPSTIDYANISEGGSNTYGMIQLSSSVLDVNNSVLDDAIYDGIFLTGTSDLLVNNTTISNCRYPVHWSTACTFDLAGINNFSINDYPAIYCYWSSINSDMNIDAADVAYYFYNSVTVANGSTLTMNPGVTAKLRSTRYIYVHGGFESLGTLANPNYITSFYDDNIIGDSNGDGAATSPAAGNWHSIRYYPEADDINCNMTYTTVRFGNSSIYVDDAAPDFDNCEFTNSNWPVHLINTASPIINNSNFAVATNTPIYMSLSANPTLTNNTFSTANNGYDAIGIIPETLSSNGYLPIREFTSIPNVTYVFYGNVTVPAGLSLTIDPGVVIKWTYHTHGLNVEGTLVAMGSAAPDDPSTPIVFTSVKDDLYGNPADTNNDGSITSPASGNWRGIHLGEGSHASLDHLYLRYAGGYHNLYHDGVYHTAALSMINSTATIDSSQFFNNGAHGLLIAGAASPNVRNNLFQSHTWTPIAMSAASTPVYSTNSFVNNTNTAMGIIGEGLGTNSVLPQRTVAGYANITYLLEQDLVVESGTNLSFDPGVVMKFRSAGIQIDVEGSLTAEGTISENIIFTSLKDDNYGNPNDTNNDGNGTAPANRDWSHLNFLPSADDPACVLDYCWLGYGGTTSDGAVRCEASGPSILNSEINSCYFGVSIRGNSSTIIDNTTIQNCYSVPVYMSVTSNPNITFNNVFTNNGYFALGIINEALTSSANLIQRNVAGVNNFTYLFLSDFTINVDGDLTMLEGVTAKFLNHCSIHVYGAFSALGSPANRIHMTSVSDDAIGGDTNDDGSSTSPARGNWGNIYYHIGADGAASTIDNSVLRFGSYEGYTYVGQIRCITSNPTITNCEITNAYWGIQISGNSSPVIEDNVFVNLDHTPIYMSLTADPQFSNNNFFNVGYQAIELFPETISVDDTLDVIDFAGYSNISYYLSGTMTVNSTTNLKIEPTVVVKHLGARYSINGSIDARSTVFTSVYDDTVGNPLDTEDNGSATTPAYSNWHGIEFNDISEDANNEIDSCNISYCYNGIYCANAAPTIADSFLDNCQYGIYLNGNSPAVLDDLQITNSQTAPVKQSLVTNADYTGVEFGSGNTYNGIWIKGETLAQNITVEKKSSFGIDNLVYILGENLTVGSSSVLTINPGVVFKNTYNHYIAVHKSLEAIGGPEPENQIVFTYIEDDFYGGDTNGDGFSTEPAQGESYFRIIFYSDSWDALCNMQHCVMAWGGYSSSYGVIDVQSASPTITNCVIRDCSIGLTASGSSNPVVNNCDIIDNNYFGIKNSNPSITINAENNWWGDLSGPYDGSDDTGSGGLYNPAGIGNQVSDYVDYDPWISSVQYPMLGDVSLNGEIHAFDASLILSYLIGDPLTLQQQAVADVTGIGGINAVDSYYILQYVVGGETTFPGEMTAYEGETSDPETIIADDITDLGDGEWLVGLTLNGVNQIKGFMLDCSYNIENVEIVDFWMAEDLNYSLRWNAENGQLLAAMAALSISAEDNPLRVEVKINSSIMPDESMFAVSRFVVNDQEFVLSSVAEDDLEEALSFALHANYPNPFNPTTLISYDLPANEIISLNVYNINGQLVRNLFNGRQVAGQHNIVWNGTNDSGLTVASGIYMLVIDGSENHAVRRMTLLK
jgi:parallel beta-helix repeat protein